ncbi:MAG: protein-L-isoaspartate O-methyltransferase [Gammaproteobacteria bacterium]|nr:protein-L-isoaspartate O-methyltransferase [Gammaproteobacteria bacterium]
MQSLHAYNFEQARINMVEQQIRPWQVFDNQILDLFAAMPRERFVPEPYQELAYADFRIPLSQNQYMMPPREEARMLQALRIQKSDLVLEIGAGSGFMTALLASLSHKVYSIEIIKDFIEIAKNNCEEFGLTNIEFEEGDAANGWPHYGPYDVIAITAGFYQLPFAFKKSLTIGGRLFCVEGEYPAMQAKLITRIEEGKWLEEVLFETQIELLINSKKAEAFVF